MNSSPADGYHAMRLRVLAIADVLEPVQATQAVPCCPEWSVHNLLSHMAGVPSDILSGNLDGVTTDPWTQAQVDARADELLANVVTELAEKGLILDAILASSGASFPANFFIDAWTHEWDLRQSLGLPATPDMTMLQDAFDYLVAAATLRLDEAGLSPIDLVADGVSHRIGSSSADPATLRTSWFEFTRLSLGRRSLRQIAALDWSHTPTDETLEALVVFAASDVDIVDPVAAATDVSTDLPPATDA